MGNILNGESLKAGIFKMGNILNGESLKAGIFKYQSQCQRHFEISTRTHSVERGKTVVATNIRIFPQKCCTTNNNFSVEHYTKL